MRITGKRLVTERERENREGEKVTPQMAWPTMLWRRRSIGDDVRKRGEWCRVCTGAEKCEAGARSWVLKAREGRRSGGRGREAIDSLGGRRF
jgi:hypothetical protein